MRRILICENGRAAKPNKPTLAPSSNSWFSLFPKACGANDISFLILQHPNIHAQIPAAKLMIVWWTLCSTNRIGAQ
jgi:hypothetical protein